MPSSWFQRHRPEIFHATVALILAVVIMFGIRSFLPTATVTSLLAYLLAMSLVTFGYYWLDKYQAQRAGRRVPEVVLHGMALLGGSPGAYVAMRQFRHKTIKPRFQRIFWIIVFLQAVALGWWAHHWWHSG
jgi:uncharacterized membrane protein YsdA (DUF1294 family)